ncbi:MAG TPA: hypothetical protein PK340_02460 [Bacilli bacterium]|jgi:hypothetical protein|nr:hypothetical protein [Bacilli bacterium]
MSKFFIDEKRIKSIVNYRSAWMFMCHKLRGVIHVRTHLFSGMVTIGRIKVSDRKIVTIDITKIDGAIMLFAVNKDEIITLIDTIEPMKKTMTLYDGNYRLRLSGDKTNIEMKVSVSA